MNAQPQGHVPLVNYVYVPIQVPVQVPTPKNDTRETEVQVKPDSVTQCSQTDGLRKPFIPQEPLAKSATHIFINYPHLQSRYLTWGHCGNSQALEITRLKSDYPPDRGGPGTVAAIRVLDSGSAEFTVASEKVCSTTVIFSKDPTHNCTYHWANFDVLLAKLGGEYVFCAGIHTQEYKDVCCGIRYESKSFEERNHPFPRIRAKTCLKWYPLRFNATKEERQDALKAESRCSNCSKAYRFARRTSRSNVASLSKHAERLQAGSSYPIHLLSPKSSKKRRSNIRQEKKRTVLQLNRNSEKLEELTVELSTEQSEELAEFIKNIPDKELQDVYKQAQEEGEDVAQTIQMAFEEDQQRNRTGSHGNRWSMATYRVALSIYSRSPASYEALRSWNIFSLPSKSSLKQYTTALLHGPGPYFQYLQDQARKYSSYQKECVASGRQKPLGEGVLILDEVKVVGKVAWNSKNGEMCGMAMDSEDFASLKDLYKELSNKKQKSSDPNVREAAEYFLQFLWRDLTSDFDIIGPHYSSAVTMDAKFTVTCMLDALRAFQSYGFKVSAVVQDGASTNLSMIKILSGTKKGAYGLDFDQEDTHEVRPFFANPMHPKEKIHFIICPTHQMKNMINQLWASRENGAKMFVFPQHGQGQITFGWKAICDMWEREKARRDALQIRVVPKLIQAYIDRDAWTKLNVKPAKIMQQDGVLAELSSFADPGDGPRPADADSVMATYKYLDSCNKLFERGFLNSNRHGHARVMDMQSEVLTNIRDGFGYFRDWCDTLMEQYGENFHIISPRERKFISWQTYDLLRVCHYGFKAFCEDFLQHNPGYYILPLKLNGSAVETLFSQFKFNAGGKLTSLNYQTAKRSVMLKRDVHGHHSAARGYRDVPLYTQEIPLRKKKEARRGLRFNDLE